MLKIARDEWPALRWQREKSPSGVILGGYLRGGPRVAYVWRFGGDTDFCSSGLRPGGGEFVMPGPRRTLRAAVRSLRYGMVPP
jgi:hypothetical protein